MGLLNLSTIQGFTQSHMLLSLSNLQRTASQRLCARKHEVVDNLVAADYAKLTGLQPALYKLCSCITCNTQVKTSSARLLQRKSLQVKPAERMSVQIVLVFSVLWYHAARALLTSPNATSNDHIFVVLLCVAKSALSGRGSALSNCSNCSFHSRCHCSGW